MTPSRNILLKLSGEALAGSEKNGLDPRILDMIASEVSDVVSLGTGVAIVIGAGNFFRGSFGEKIGIDRVRGDHMGMLATVMNSLAVQNTLLKKGIDARVMTSIEMTAIAEPYIITRARSYLQKGRVVIVGGGTGHPFFTTDTAAALRGVELGMDILVKATRVDGVYTADPEVDRSAVRIPSITYSEVLQRKLKIMDMTAISLCMENNLPIAVINVFKEGELTRLVKGESVGTIIT